MWPRASRKNPARWNSASWRLTTSRGADVLGKLLMRRRQFATRIGAGEQGGGKARVDPQEGDGLDQPRHFREPRAKALEHEACKVWGLPQQPLEQGWRHNDKPQIGFRRALGGIIQSSHQAERGLDAGFAGRNAIKQQPAPVFRRHADAGAAFEQEHKALAGGAGGKQDFSARDGQHRQRSERFARRGREAGQRREGVKPGRGAFRLQSLVSLPALAPAFAPQQPSGEPPIWTGGHGVSP